ncbi:MAG TPA: helix-turn-helix transcriptional regulator [Aggregatilineales bacterium]|nr:helix-turn-helix transcriptional regulator [Anaerolineales bacterium]HRE48575.1 helix-turn-helix transcriptional regulator [Aggregatilineales bacterium]
MTDAELAVLSLLSESPNYDHRLNELIEARGLRRWTAIGNSSLYYILDKLERQGLIARVVTDDPRRKYEITAAGTGVLQTAVTDLLSSPRAYDKSFELGLANLHVLKPSHVRGALASREQDLTVQLGRLETMVGAGKVADSFQAGALFSHRITLIKAELAWLRTFIEEWSAQAGSDPEVVIEPAIIPRNRQVVLPQDPDSIHKQTTLEFPSHQKKTPPGFETPAMTSPPTPPPTPSEDRE